MGVYPDFNISAFGSTSQYQNFTQSLCYFKLKKHKPWFDEECSKVLHERKWFELQQFQDPSQKNENIWKTQ
jgi:hypothetical protein